MLGGEDIVEVVVGWGLVRWLPEKRGLSPGVSGDKPAPVGSSFWKKQLPVKTRDTEMQKSGLFVPIFSTPTDTPFAPWVVVGRVLCPESDGWFDSDGGGAAV